MKLVTFEDPHGTIRPGVLHDDHVIALPFPSMRALFEGGDEAFEVARQADGEELPLEDVRLKAPIEPKKLVHTAGNFAEHEDEIQRAGYNYKLRQVVYLQNVDAIIGPEETIIYPEHLTSELDYELELAVVVKRSGKDFAPSDADAYIGGYTIFNDVTARDIQREEMESGVFGFCKAIATFCPVGPWIVTPDEVPDPHRLKMELRVNGQVRQSSNTSFLRRSISDILATYSPLTYSAGDLVSTGTIGGVAGFSEHPEDLYLRVGDVVECHIEGIGILRNYVGARLNSEAQV